MYGVEDEVVVMELIREADVGDEWRRFRRALVDAGKAVLAVRNAAAPSEQFGIELQVGLRLCSSRYFGLSEADASGRARESSCW